ncbi:cytochrome P450 [Streptomyces sp. CMSTAAHL-2]|uniref:cytochrome P450 n=1 Tax=Streptomyces sp. CMSTAAHL-2 TaxID=2904522 RepID=UPI001E5D03C2|nr:cytochrome P450 [Streptomyces sp. CMSTAAHL-2]MCE3029601.1 cytochrome P450 [Streptomyces sp. CMSTAAHL-2]
MSPTKTLADPIDVMGRLLSFEGKQDPYPLYEQMRAHGPVVDVGGAHLFVTGHAECARALREPDLLSTDAAVQDARLPGWREHASWSWLTKNMLFSNDPAHERYRRFFSSAFSARSVKAWRPLVERRAACAVERVARLAAGGEVVDLVAEFSFPMAAGVIGELLGIPDEDHDAFRADVGDITLTLEPIRDMGQLTAGDAAMERLAVYFHDLVARRRAHPTTDLTSSFTAARDTGGELSETELVANLMLLLVAATEAPQDLLSNMVRLALTHPAQAERLRTEPDFAAGFTDETLRFDPAAQILNRVASRDLDFFGVKVAQGVPLTLLIAAGNRDPRRFTNPDVFDPARRDNSPLTFSGGAHFCLGAALARMSAETAVPLLLRRLPGLRLAGEATFRDQIVQRGHGRLPVTTD